MRLQRSLAKLTGCLFRISFTEDGRTRNYPFGALANYRRNIIQADTAIDLDMDIQAARINHTPQATYLVKRGVYEGLPTKAGIYRHNQNVIDKRKRFFDGSERGSGVQNHTGPAA